MNLVTIMQTFIKLLIDACIAATITWTCFAIGNVFHISTVAIATFAVTFAIYHSRT